MRATLTAIALSTVLMVVPATAAARPAGTTPNAERLHALGVSVSWPLKRGAAILAPGTRLTVSVRSERRAVEVTLLRVGATNRAVARRRLRHGTFRATVPAGGGRHYALRLRVGRLVYRSWIDTPAPVAPPAPAPAPAPTPGPKPADPFSCPAATAATPGSALTLETTSVPVGGTFNYTLTNTGGLCLSTGYGYTMQRLVDGAWVTEPAPPGTAYPAIAIILRPGRTFSTSATAWSTLPAGHYRMTVAAYPEPATAPATPDTPKVLARAELDVTA